MKKILFTLFIIIFVAVGTDFAQAEGLKDYDGIQLPKGTFIPVLNTEEISTVYCDEGSKVKFIATNDLYLYQTNVIPQKTEFYGFIEKINEPIIGTNASMMIKITKMRLSDGFEIPIRGYIYTDKGNLIGGELSAPEVYDQKPLYRQGYNPLVISYPGEKRKMGEHKVIKSGSDLIIMLTGPLYVTHTVTN